MSEVNSLPNRAQENSALDSNILNNPTLQALIQELGKGNLTAAKFVEQFNELSKSLPQKNYPSLPISSQEINPLSDKLFNIN